MSEEIYVLLCVFPLISGSWALMRPPQWPVSTSGTFSLFLDLTLCLYLITHLLFLYPCFYLSLSCTLLLKSLEQVLFMSQEIVFPIQKTLEIGHFSSSLRPERMGPCAAQAVVKVDKRKMWVISWLPLQSDASRSSNILAKINFHSATTELLRVFLAVTVHKTWCRQCHTFKNDEFSGFHSKKWHIDFK